MPTWNAGPLLQEVLAGIERQQGAELVEKVAFDSGSRDGTVDLLRQHGFQVTSIPQAEYDHGGTRDRMIEQTTGDVIVLLTQDATPADPDWLRALLACFEDERVAAAYCRQVPRPDCNPVIARRLSGWMGEARRVQELAPGQRLEDLEPMQRLLLCAHDHVAAAVRRSAWQRFRLGPRRFGEDVAFAEKAIRAGFRIVYEPSSRVVHSHSRSAWSEGKRTFCDHRNLAASFGIRTIPDRATLQAALRDGTAEHLRFVDGLDLPVAMKAELRTWTRDYVKWSCWGQYLGARAALAPRGVRGAWLRWLGRWLERGI